MNRFQHSVFSIKFWIMQTDSTQRKMQVFNLTKRSTSHLCTQIDLFKKANNINGTGHLLHLFLVVKAPKVLKHLQE